MALSAVGLLLSTSVVWASDVDVAVVDVTVPATSVTLQAGQSAAITINMSVSGNQVGTATFEVYRDWVLSGGTFAGTNPQEFTVSPRAGGDPATTFSTSGTLSVALGQADGAFTLAAAAFDITNSNQTGAKLVAGDPSNYHITVTSPPPPADSTPPDITPSVSGTLGNNGWYVSDVTVSWSVVDNESTISSTSGCGPTTINTDTPGITLTCTATSTGGTASQSVTIKRDATAPAASASAAPAANANSWNDTDVTVSFTGTDNLSGIDSCDPAVVLSSEGASQSASGTCTDLAGNVSASAAASGINIDKTDPEVSLVGGPANGASYYFGFVPAAPTCSASDALSGLDGPCSVTGYGTTVGSHTVTASATDKAGNSASAAASYSVLAWTLSGFYSPVDMNGVFNVVKGGSTVPLKFEVFAGTTELTSTSVVSTFVQTKVACDGGSPTDEIEVTTTGGTSLRYDTTGGQFIQNWQTPKLPGQCYKVTMTTQDGSFLQAFFRLK
jgi:hypothetical protein